MIITVKSTENKSTSKGLWYLVIDENGKSHNIFESKVPDMAEKLPLLTIGQTVELIKVKTDKGWDTTDIRPSSVKEAIESDKSGEFATYNLKQKSIERQNALTNAVNYCHDLPDKTTHDVLLIAEMFFKWTSEGITPPATTKAPENAPQGETQPSKLAKVAIERGAKINKKTWEEVLHKQAELKIGTKEILSYFDLPGWPDVKAKHSPDDVWAALIDIAESTK